MTIETRKEAAIVLFGEKEIRRLWHNEEWWFSVIDICTALTASTDGSAYWRKLKQRLIKENSEVVTFCHGLKLTATDGKKYITDCANTEGIFRIIQSIPSPKAEPFKRWLAKLGYERIQEIEDPELAQNRMKQLYEQKGYPKEWIEKRLRGIAIRQNLTEEWQDRGINSSKDYAILTAEISKATFGMTPSEYKKYKNLPTQSSANLRDHMTDLELIFTMLGEKMTTEISRQEKPEGMPENKKVAHRGGAVAGSARKTAERELGNSIISQQNYLQSPSPPLPNKTTATTRGHSQSPTSKSGQSGK
jgi:DNA-damage-inducible protein D